MTPSCIMLVLGHMQPCHQVCCDNYSLPCAQASHYQKQMELFVLPECLYGKYTPCEEVNPAPSAQAAAVIMWTANLCMPYDCLSQSCRVQY